MEPTKKQIQEWKNKAEKWDKLSSEIGKYYPDDEKDPEITGDLCDIGEAASIAFGYL